MRVNRDEALRYLGFSEAADNETEAILNACIPALENAACFKYTLREFPITVSKNSIELNGASLKSSALAKHLKNCTHALLFAATLGTKVDTLIKAYSKTDMPACLVLHACAASLLESSVDAAQAELKEIYAKRGLCLHMRFSPGYADFSLSYQKMLLRVLDAPKTIGLSCTEKSMLIPLKSITALIGISNSEIETNKNACSCCTLHETCPYKKAETDKLKSICNEQLNLGEDNGLS